MKHRISVVMATYNGAQYILKQLDSIVRQSMPIDELIILDDKSTDNTPIIVEQFIKENTSSTIKFDFQKNIENIGATKTFLKAIKESSGDFIILCDQDDIWMPNKVHTLYDLAKDLKNKPGFSFSNLDLIDDNGVEIEKTFWEEWNIKPYTLSVRRLSVGNMVPGCSMIINKAMAEELNKHEQHPFIYHDHLIAIIGAYFENHSYTDESLVKYRTHLSSVTQKLRARGITAYLKFMKNVVGLERTFLEADIKNAEYFLNFYKASLTQEDVNSLKALIALKGKSNYKKRVLLESYLHDFK